MENTKNIIFCQNHPHFQVNLISINEKNTKQQKEESVLQLHCVKCLYEKKKNLKQEQFLGENIIPFDDFQHQMRNQYNFCIQNDKKEAISLISQLKQNQQKLNEQTEELTDDLIITLLKLNEEQVSLQKQEFLDNLEKLNKCQAIGEIQSVFNYLENFVQPLQRDLQNSEELFILNKNKLNQYQIQNITNVNKYLENIIKNIQIMKMQDDQKEQKSQWLAQLVDSQNQQYDQSNKGGIQLNPQNNIDQLLSKILQEDQEVEIKDQNIQELETDIQNLQNEETLVDQEMIINVQKIQDLEREIQKLQNQQISYANKTILVDQEMKIKDQQIQEFQYVIQLLQNEIISDKKKMIQVIEEMKNKDQKIQQLQNEQISYINKTIQVDQEMQIKNQKIQEQEMEIQQLKNEQTSYQNNPLINIQPCINNIMAISYQQTNYQVKIKYCKGRKNGCNPNSKIWGSNPYTSDTDYCLAAKHFGVIGEQDGYYIIVLLNFKLKNFKGSTKNGVISSSYGNFGAYFIMPDLNFTNNCYQLEGNIYHCKGQIKGCGGINQKCENARQKGKITENGGIFYI